jgi:hypothetical protein
MLGQALAETKPRLADYELSQGQRSDRSVPMAAIRRRALAVWLGTDRS